MWHPEQTWSLLHDERHAALVAPVRRAAEQPPSGGGPTDPVRVRPVVGAGRPDEPAEGPAEPRAPRRPQLVAARVRLALARRVLT